MFRIRHNTTKNISSVIITIALFFILGLVFVGSAEISGKLSPVCPAIAAV